MNTHTDAHRGVLPRRAARSVAALTVALTALALAAVAVATAQPASALSGSQFKAGNIISNHDFYNSKSMTVAGVQHFLNSEETYCAPGHTCLRDFAMKTTSQPAKRGLCRAYKGQPRQSAAQIIAHVGRDCGINPQVLIVLLQKEQGLVTSSAPSNWNYNEATGANCPDSSGCSKGSAGFFKQVYLAAYQFQYYKAHPYYYQYLAGQTNNILYNPKRSCGSSPVYIQNEATASLYIYTPYQPNAAALRNLHGTGDKCSAYGNRNFWVFFHTWFGSGASHSDPPPDPPAPPPASTPPPVSTPPPAAQALAYDKGGVFLRMKSGRMYHWDNTGRVKAPFQDLKRTRLRRTGWQHYDLITAGDVNHDGAPDLLARRRNGSLWLLDNSGYDPAPFPSAYKIAKRGWNVFTSVVAADVDGDGYADLLARNKYGGLWLYPNTHKATKPYRKRVAVSSAGFSGYNLLVAGDLNDDGYTDLVARGSDASLWEYISTGNPRHPFGSPVKIARAGWNAYNAITTVDVNSDGKADLIVRDKHGMLWLYVNTGNLSKPFHKRRNIGAGWGNYNMIIGARVHYPAGACPPRGAAPFHDIKRYSTFCAAASWLKSQGVSTGYAGGTFHPKGAMSRAAMAAFLFRLSHSGAHAPTCAFSPFKDVPTSKVFCGPIAWLKAQHASTGYRNGRFQPAASISRQAMAAFLYRMGHSGRKAPRAGAAPFADVATSSPFSGAIAWLKTKRSSEGYSDGGYHPSARMSRQAMAAFLYRLNN